MLDLETLRAEFARYLAENMETRWGMDAALMHVCRMAYEAGRADAGAPPQTLRAEDFDTRHGGIAAIHLPLGTMIITIPQIK